MEKRHDAQRCHWKGIWERGPDQVTFRSARKKPRLLQLGVGGTVRLRNCVAKFEGGSKRP